LINLSVFQFLNAEPLEHDFLQVPVFHFVGINLFFDFFDFFVLFILILCLIFKPSVNLFKVKNSKPVEDVRVRNKLCNILLIELSEWIGSKLTPFKLREVLGPYVFK
jgi:hypothetical protein